MCRHHWIVEYQSDDEGDRARGKPTLFPRPTAGRTCLPYRRWIDKKERKSIECYGNSDVAGNTKDDIDQRHVYDAKHHHHMETEKLTSSLRNACHQPGGKKSKSPGSSVAAMASGTTSSQNRGNSSEGRAAKTSTWEVLDNCGTCLLTEGLRWETVYNAEDALGGASHTVLRPTTWT